MFMFFTGAIGIIMYAIKALLGSAYIKVIICPKKLDADNLFMKKIGYLRYKLQKVKEIKKVLNRYYGWSVITMIFLIIQEIVVNSALVFLEIRLNYKDSGFSSEMRLLMAFVSAFIFSYFIF